MDLLLELLLDLLLHVFYHVPIRGRFAPPYNYVINTCSSRSSSSSSSRSMDPWIHIFYFEPYFLLWNDEYWSICFRRKAEFRPIFRRNSADRIFAPFWSYRAQILPIFTSRRRELGSALRFPPISLKTWFRKIYIAKLLRKNGKMRWAYLLEIAVSVAPSQFALSDRDPRLVAL